MNRIVILGSEAEAVSLAMEIRKEAKREGVGISEGDILTVAPQNAKAAVTADCVAVLAGNNESLAGFLASEESPAHIYITQGDHPVEDVAVNAVRALRTLRNLTALVRFGAALGIVTMEGDKVVIWLKTGEKRLASVWEFAAILLSDEEGLAQFMRGVLGRGDVRIS